MKSHSWPVAGPEFELKQPVSRVWDLSDLAFLSLGKKQLLASSMIQNLEELKHSGNNYVSECNDINHDE